MALYLLYFDGTNETRYKIVEDLTIGRAAGEVIVPDPTVSTKHAKFKYDDKDGWFLLDLGSRNGIVYDGRRLRQIPIAHGVKFMIGKALFKTVEIEDTQSTRNPPPVSANGEEVSIAKDYPVGWREKMQKLARSVERAAADTPTELTAFNPKISLKFVRGVQYPTLWTLGYGPRKFGSGTPEFPLYEPDAPEVSFMLSPTTKGVFFQSYDKEKVLLNGQPIKSDILGAGDEIEVLATKIIVSFAE